MKLSTTRLAVSVAAAAILGASPLPAQSYTLVPNLVYGTYAGGAQSLLLDLYLPLAGAVPRPVIVWIHGGAWLAGSRFPVPSNVTAFCAQGYAVASIDYRLSGTATWPAQIHDCRGAVRWLRANAAAYGLDPDRIGAWGSSAGGHLAAILGTSGGVASITIGGVTVDLEGATGGNLGQSSRVHSVVDWYGPTDFLAMRDFPTFDHEGPTAPESLLLGAPIQTVPALAATANPITYLTPDDPPLLILHGTVDTTVPFNQSELLHAAARGEAGVRSTFFPVQGNGHGGPGFTTPQAVAVVTAHLDSTLLNPPSTRASVSATDPSGAEAGPDPGAFTIARTGSVAAPLAVRVAFSGAAEPGADYAAPGALAVIPAGASSAAVTVAAADDGLVEGPETVRLTIAPSAGYRIDAAAQAATVTIADDEPAAGLPVVEVAASDPGAAEGPGNPGAFLVTRTGSLASPLVVQYRVSGSARSGSDFVSLGGSATIPAGAGSVSVPLVVLDDAGIEPSETVLVALQAGSGYVVGPSAAAGAWIADDDKNPAIPTLSVLLTDGEAAEAPPDAGTFVLSRTLGTALGLTVPIALGGTAASGADVTGLAGTATFAPGSAWAPVTLAPLSDGIVEGDENVVLAVLPAPPYQLASAPAQELWIEDGDLPPDPGAALALEIAPLVIGTTSAASVALGQPGQAFGVAVATGPGFLDVPLFGQVRIDLATAVVVGGGALGPSGLGGFSFQIPDDASLIGARVWAQAYAIDAGTGGGSLSPAVVRRVAGRRF